MTDYIRVIAIGGTVGALLAGSLAAPSLISALAQEPVQVVAETVEQLFPAEAIDPKIFRRYAITFDESVSTQVQRTTIVRKIGYGHKTSVAIVKTPTGTYSSDALLSPHVRYPGIEVGLTREWRDRYRSATATSDAGTGRWTSFSRGSFVYYTYSFEPSPRS